jgi:hypothetical protein
MTLEPLKVDAEMLGAAGQRLLTAAQGLPDAPEPFTPAYGSDALSQVLSTDVPKAEAPIIEGLPPLKQAAVGTAESVVEAARRYLSADSHLKSKIEATMNQPVGGGSPAGGGGSGSPATSPGGGAPAATAGAPASAGAGGMGAMGGMMGMPMQMAQQAGQIPQQIGGMAGSLPQSAMQGAQQVGDQVKQMVEQFSGQDSDQKDDAAEPGGKHRAEESVPEQPAGAAPGQAEGERAPASPAVPSPKPATQADPTINL